MQYEVKIEDFTADVEIEIKSTDFDLISEIQMAIAQAIEDHKDVDLDNLFEEDEDEDNEGDEQEDDVLEEDDNTIVIDDNPDTRTTITIHRV